MRTSRPPTTTATSSTRCGDDRLLRPHRRHARPSSTGPTTSRRGWRGSPAAWPATSAGDWGDLDAEDRAANDHALRHGQGRVLSAYRLPAELAGTTAETQLWVITDDLDDPDTATTMLWPSDY